MADKPTAIISNRLTDILGWHVWTVLSLTGTTTLLYLNFSEYSIGGELGGSPSSSANIIGILQFGVKAHELLIVASLVAIAHQWILGNLMSGGLLLGLLGADGALATPSFLISTRFRLALGYGFRGIYTSHGEKRLKNDPDRLARLRMFRLAIFIFWGCLTASLAGPASGVLMIPRVDWFYHSKYEYPPAELSTLPNIMIGTSPGFVNGNHFSESNVFALPDQLIGSGLRYWKDVSGRELRYSRLTLEEKSQHRFHDLLGPVYVNTTGSYNRELDTEWSGGTRIMTSARNIYYLSTGDTSNVPLREIGKGWTGLKSTDTTHGFDARVTCRAREKIACSNSTVPSDNFSYPDWCYLSVNENDTTGTLRESWNLLMAYDFTDNWGEPRVWFTEGPRIEGNSHYSDTIEVVFEKPPEHALFMHNLTICSFSATLVAAMATSYGTDYTAEKVEYFDYVMLPDGKTAKPRKFLFHENWLDRAYNYDPNLWLSGPEVDSSPIEGSILTREDFSYPVGSMVYPDNFTYPERPGLNPNRNLFGVLGLNLVFALGWDGTEESQQERNEAFPVEAVVGGLLTYILSWSLPCGSQYSMPYEQIPERFRLEPPQSFPIIYSWEIYRKGYGFRLSTRTAYLGVAILLLHAIIAIVGSLWQLKRNSVIRAWSTVPDYALLGSGSPSLVMAYPNTCAGVTGDNALAGLVRVAETIPPYVPPGALPPVPTIPHLEIVAVDYSRKTATTPVDLANQNKRYG